MPSTVGPLAMMILEPLSFEKSLSLNSDLAELILKEPSTGRAYLCFCASRPLFLDFQKSRSREVFVAQILREDAEQLFLFESFLERKIFLDLWKLDSVGPKTAATFLWHFGVDGVRHALESKKNVLGKAPGLGPKTMEKILSQLWSRREEILTRFSDGPREQAPSKNFQDSGSSLAEPEAFSGPLAPQEILQTMEKLGLRPQEVQKLWKELCSEDPDFPKLKKPELLKKMFQGWGRLKSFVASSGSSVENFEEKNQN